MTLSKMEWKMNIFTFDLTYCLDSEIGIVIASCIFFN